MNPPPAAAVVIGLDCMTGLQTARILARRGVPVLALAADTAHPCAQTRLCRRIVASPLDGEGLVRTLVDLGPALAGDAAVGNDRRSAPRGEGSTTDVDRSASSGDQPAGRAVLYPCTDAAVLTLSRCRDVLAPWYHVVLAAPDVVETLMDKLRFHAYAESVGLPVPQAFVLASRADAIDAAARLRYPAILKPPVKTAAWQANTKAKVFRVTSADDLVATYDRCQGWADALVAQAWVDGTDADLYSYNGYFDAASMPLAGFVARKLRQWPPETGTSCLGEECRNDIVRDVAERLFEGIGYRGLGYVELKRDRRTGEHFIIEPNIGRPTGRSAIAEAGGVELLYTQYCDALGLPLPAARTQVYGGVKWIHLRRDVQSALHYWRTGELTLGEWRRSWRGRKAHALWDPADPRPFWSDIWRTLVSAARRGVTKQGRSTS